MSDQLNDRKCPACGGNNITDGKLGVYKHTFIPARRFMMLGYRAKGFVCLDCGFLGHYIAQNDLNEIRRQV